MRLKNIKNANKIIENNPHFLKNPTEYKTKFQTLFDNNNKIEVEIGSGKGSFIIKKALNNPDINYIAVEKIPSVLVSLIKKIEGKNIKNLKVICYDAEKIDEVFYKEVDRIYLNFSDPWPKSKHEKRRLTHHIFLNKYEYIFKKDSIIEIKTDNKLLFAFSLESLSSYKYIFKYISLDLHNEPKENILKENIQTEYEKKFSKYGPIYKMIAVKKCQIISK